MKNALIRLTALSLLIMVSLLLIASVTSVNLATQVQGICPIANGCTGVATANAHTIFRGPIAGSAAAPDFQSINILSPVFTREESYRWVYWVPCNANGILCGVGYRGITTFGTLNAATGGIPGYLSISTGATSGNNTTMGNDVAETRTDYDNYAWWKVSQSTTSTVRVWYGLTDNSTAAYVSNDDRVQNHLMYRYSTNAGDTHFQCVSNNASATSNIVDSGVTPSTTGFDFLEIYWNAGAATSFWWINGTQVCGSSGITTKAPATGKPFVHVAGLITTLTNAAATIKAHSVGWRMNDN